MAMVTMLLPRDWLVAVLPDFDVCGGDSSWLASSITEILCKAIVAGVKPELVEDPRPHVKVNLRITGLAGGVAPQRAKEAGLSLGGYCKQVLGALALQGRTAELAAKEREVDVETLGLLGDAVSASKGQMSIRPAQAQVYEQITETLKSGVCGLTEASTGTGKTLAMLCAAIEHAKKDETRVVIAAPSIALLDQFVSTFHEVLEPLRVNIPIRVVLGRQNFVSAGDVKTLLEHEKVDFDIAAAAQWLSDGGWGTSGLGKEVPWLAASLEEVCPMFPLQECELSPETPESDKAQQVYRAQFAEDRGVYAELVLASHAMVANDLRSRMALSMVDDEFRQMTEERFTLLKQIKERKRKDTADLRESLNLIDLARGSSMVDITEESGLLPYYSAILIDEAHQFEQNVSSALSEYVSLRAFVRRLTEYADMGHMSAEAVRRISQAVTTLSEEGAKLGADGQIMVELGKDERLPIRRTLDVIMSDTRRLKAPEDGFAPTLASALYKRLRYELRTIAAAAKYGTKTKSYLQFSPSKAWPQIYVGKSSVAEYLTLLWTGMHAAACVSATLYLKRGEEDSANYQKMVLSIPEGRAKEFRPAVPGWLYRPVVGVWTPEAALVDERMWLKPPTKSDGESGAQRASTEAVWLDQLAKTLQWVCATAAGGVMVAMTSYDSCEKLKPLLATVMGERMVVAERRFTLKEQTRRFLDLTRQGLKPVWLSVGSAWTGLDVGGHDPWIRAFGTKLEAAQDNVFTDLVVPRVPYGTNRSITHMMRMQTRPEVQWDVMEAMFRTKQVVGRLVRREALPANRRVFILDGRLNEKAFAGNRQILLNMLRAYRMRTLTLGETRQGP